MGLTSWPFFVVAALLLVVAPAVTLVVWGRVGGPYAARVLARFGLLVTCQVTAVLMVLLVLNDNFGFYSSWNDLFGATGDRSVYRAAVPLTGGGQKVGQWYDRPRVLHPTQKFDSYTDGFRRTTLAGKASGLDGEVDVWLPPQYTDAAYRARQFPVLMLLHGVPGAPPDWVELMHVAQHAHRAIDRGKLPPFIMVVPTISPRGHDTACSDTPEAKVATWLTRDVRTMMLTNFRTTEQPDGWGLMGYSTGGFCAAKLPLQYPSLFTVGVSLAGDDFAGDPAILPNSDLREHNSPLWLLKHGITPRVHLLLMASKQDTEDPVVYAETLQAAARNTETTVDTDYFEEGGHNQGTWEKMLPHAFKWLSLYTTPRWSRQTQS